MRITVYSLIRIIPYVCLLSICGVVFAFGFAGYYSYRLTKLRIFNNTLYIPINYSYPKKIDEIKQWIKENINGYVSIEADIYIDGEWGSPNHPKQEILRGWHIRFTHKTDAMAFKLVWITKDGRFDIL